MGFGDDRQAALDRWVGLYRDLLNISRRMLDTAQTCPDADQLLEAMGPALSDWRRVRDQITVLEQTLRAEWGVEKATELFRLHILSILQDVQDNLSRSSAIMQTRLSETGRSIQSARDRRQATKAYSALEQDWHEAHFFDEKK
ncbi:MAG: hypothetical protein A9Z00_12070 [Thermobacillus sp. ZCTH02-B1]|uniref:hypothetical protein n=1 Tax=Thermobacillus sp. ZCTH02-B1 TaxID=1858795 RepID=UPI000B57F698|nr:hypothetical protein [Thermobacillus sp. ZCTH02-B1]OUM94977.1 MAG: hypothetical protein A9Z00_12070 [Thermobacillus sp. ZCTH02-B1]